MIDIHSHVIYGVDDGAKTIEDSIAMIKNSYEEGINLIVATPHFMKKQYEQDLSLLNERFHKITIEVKKISSDIMIFSGGEIYYSEDALEKINKGLYPTINNTNYLLVEFNTSILFNDMYNALNNIVMLGKKPIIAHIERYRDLAFDKEKVDKLIGIGCLTQVNSVNVLKQKIMKDLHKVFKQRVKYLLDNNLVHLVASDMHDINHRKSYMKEAYEVISDTYGITKAQDLFQNNQMRILYNKEAL